MIVSYQPVLMSNATFLETGFKTASKKISYPHVGSDQIEHILVCYAADFICLRLTFPAKKNDKNLDLNSD